jgi:hypothetical protein
MTKRAKNGEQTVAERRAQVLLQKWAAPERRTMGRLFALRRTVLADMNQAAVRLTSELDEIYAGHPGPGEDTQSNYPHLRYMALEGAGSRSAPLRVFSFGWSNSAWLTEWQRTWSTSCYTGYDSPHLIKGITKRKITSDLDTLAATFEVSEAFEDNNPALCLRFKWANDRVYELHSRLSVVERRLQAAVLGVLADKKDWKAGEESFRRRSSWVKLSFDDGTAVLVSPEGAMVYEDTVEVVQVSMDDLPPARYTSGRLRQHLLRKQS